MKLRTRNHTVAWLGMIAMLLVVFAPLVSQLLASARADTPVGIICSAAAGEQPGTKHSASPDALSACGYCNLLAHHVPAPAIASSPLPSHVVLAAAPVSAQPAYIPQFEFPSGRPRDPPLVS